MAAWFSGIRLKFLILLSVPVAALVIFSFISFRVVNNFSSSIRDLTTQDIPSALSLSAMNSGMMTMTVNLHEAAGETDPARRQRFIQDAQEEYDGFVAEIKEYKSYKLTEEETVLFAKFEDLWSKQKNNVDETFRLLKSDDTAAAGQLLRTTYSEGADQIDKIFSKLDESQTHSSEKAIEESEAFSSQNKILVAALAGISMLVTIALGFAIVTTLVRALRKVTTELTGAAGAIGKAVTEMETSATTLSNATTEQAASIQQTAASLEEITTMIARSQDGANTAASTSVDSRDRAEHGQNSATRMMETMSEINSSNTDILNQVNKSNEQMSEVVRVIQEIATKTKVINDIVFQTKLLSFNASVEAARAGEHGKGFAVVAEEIGTLAQMSGNAATEISDMLHTSTQKVEGLVRDMQKEVESIVKTGKEKVESGVAVAQECSSILSEIVESARQVSELAQEISDATREQSQGVNEINTAVTQLNAVTQQNASTSEQTASSAQELSKQAATLNSAVRALLYEVDGKNAA